MRATSRTTLVLGDLLEIPVGVCGATGEDDVRFDTAALDGAKRVQQFVHPTRMRQMIEVDPEEVRLIDGLPVGEIVERLELIPETCEDTIKGIRVGDTFREVPSSEIDYATAATALDRVEVLEFVDYRRVPTDRLTGSFWIQPDPGFARPLAVLMEAMRQDGAAMVVKWAARSRQRLGVIRVRRTPDGDALLLNNVVFAAQWRDADTRVLEAGAETAIDPKAVEAARSIIKSMHGTGKALEDTIDDLPTILKGIVATAGEGVYDDQLKVLELIATYVADGLIERAAKLHAWAEQRWPELDEKRQEVERVIADGGEGVGERLAALIG